MSSKLIYHYRHQCDSCREVVELGQCTKIPKLPPGWERAVRKRPAEDADSEPVFEDLCGRCAWGRAQTAKEAARDRELGIEWYGVNDEH